MQDVEEKLRLLKTWIKAVEDLLDLKIINGPLKDPHCIKIHNLDSVGNGL